VVLQQLAQVQEQVQAPQEVGQQSQQDQVSQLVQAEAQVEVLAAEQVRELVEVPPQEVE
jgi:hypothetical protein